MSVLITLHVETFKLWLSSSVFPHILWTHLLFICATPYKEIHQACLLRLSWCKILKNTASETSQPPIGDMLTLLPSSNVYIVMSLVIKVKYTAVSIMILDTFTSTQLLTQHCQKKENMLSIHWLPWSICPALSNALCLPVFSWRESQMYFFHSRGLVSACNFSAQNFFLAHE